MCLVLTVAYVTQKFCGEFGMWSLDVCERSGPKPWGRAPPATQVKRGSGCP